MRRHLAVLVGALALAAIACGGGDDRPGPAQVTAEWLDAVIGGDAETATALTLDGHPELVTLVEGAPGTDPGLLLERGMSEEARREFWRSFGEGLGDDAEGLEPGTSFEFTLDEVEFAAVALGEATVFLREEDGEWRVDLIATVLPPLVRPLRAVADQVAPDLPGPLADAAVSLQAALDRGEAAGLAPQFQGEIEELVAELRSRG